MEKFRKFVVIPVCIIVSAIVIIVALMPILWAVLSSFKTDFEIFSNPIALPKRFSIESYKYGISVAPVFTFFFNSIVVAVFGTLLNVYSVAMASYVAARRDFALKNLLIVVISMTMFVSICLRCSTRTLLALVSSFISAAMDS